MREIPYRCPGSENRNLHSGYFRCHNCGETVEIFSDENRIRCKCGQYVYREATPSCAEWCKNARECLGEERWKKLLGNE